MEHTELANKEGKTDLFTCKEDTGKKKKKGEEV